MTWTIRTCARRTGVSIGDQTQINRGGRASQQHTATHTMHCNTPAPRRYQGQKSKQDSQLRRHDSHLHTWQGQYTATHTTHCNTLAPHMCQWQKSKWLSKLNKAHSTYVWHDSSRCVTWLIHTYLKWCVTYVTWLIHSCDMGHATPATHMWHDSFDICDMTHSTYVWHMWHDSFDMWHDSFESCHATHMWHDSFDICLYFRDKPHEYVRQYTATHTTHCNTLAPHNAHSTYVCIPVPLLSATIMWESWHDSFRRVTWLIHICEMTHPYVWHDSFMWTTYVCISLPLLSATIMWESWHDSKNHVIVENHVRFSFSTVRHA